MNALSMVREKLVRWCAAAFVAGVVALPAANADAGNAVKSVETTTLPGGKVVVRVNLKSPLATTPAGFTVGNPPRIALDLPDTANASGRNTVDANVGSLVNVNVVQAGNRTRLVLNLNKAVEYEARLEGSSLLIALGDVGAGTAPVNTNPVFAESAATASTHGIRDVDFRRGAAGEGRIVTTLSDAKTGINVRQQSNGIVVDFIDTDLPRALRRRLDVTDFGTPVKTVETYTLGGNTRMVIQPRGGWEYSAYQTDNSFVVEVKTAEDGQRKTADGKPRYTGEKLSLNFQNVEVRSVLQVIADFTGLNIVASDTVTGNLTLRLKDVPWDQALDLIMQTKGLDKRENGNVIWIAPKDELLAKEKLEFEAKNQVVELEPLVTEYIQLNYLRADEAHALLSGSSLNNTGATGTSNMVNCSAQAGSLTGTSNTQSNQQSSGNSEQKILTKRGRSSYELKTNTLIINDTPTKIQEIRTLLSKLDVPTRQVQIEARVVIADDGFGRQLGVRLGTQLGKTIGGGDGEHRITASGNQLATFYQTTTSAAGAVSTTSRVAPFYNVNLPAATGANAAGNLVLDILNTASGNLLSLELQALEADNRGTIISNPRVVTSNQKPAVILQGTQIPYITPAAGNTPASVTFKDAFLCLLVDPQVLNNDSVIMTVEVQKDAVGAAAALGNPTIDTKRVKTQVRVANGETAVLGGIFEKISRDDVVKVPFFGDIPIIGHLFKSTDRQDKKLELLIFLTPRILDERLNLR